MLPHVIALLFTHFSVMLSAVLVLVKTEGGLPQQTEATTAWSSFGTHSQRKATALCSSEMNTITVFNYIKL